MRCIGQLLGNLAHAQAFVICLRITLFFVTLTMLNSLRSVNVVNSTYDNPHISLRASQGAYCSSKPMAWPGLKQNSKSSTRIAQSEISSAAVLPFNRIQKHSHHSFHQAFPNIYLYSMDGMHQKIIIDALQTQYGCQMTVSCKSG